MRKKPKVHQDESEPLPEEILTEPALRAQIEEARQRIASGVSTGHGMTKEQLRELARELDGLDPRP
jgi:hypothetical protein